MSVSEDMPTSYLERTKKAEILFVILMNFSAHKNPDAKIEAIPMPMNAEQTWVLRSVI